MFLFRRILLPQIPSTSTKNPILLDVRWKNFREFSTAAEGIPNNLGKFVTVSTTGYSFIDSNGKRVAKYGIFWGENDPRNAIRTLPKGGSSVSAMLTAILEVINTACEEDPPPSLLIYSDLESSSTLLRDLSTYAKRDFFSRNHSKKMENSEILRDIFVAVQGLHLKICHKKSDDEFSKNQVIAAILKGIRQKIEEKDAEKLENPEKIGLVKYCRTENPVDPLARIELEVGTRLDKDGNMVTGGDREWPKVYVAAKCQNVKDFISAGFCTHWPGGQCAGGQSFRFSPFPVTLFRAELAAIEEALKQAVDSDLKKVTVITSSAHFMVAFRRHWIRDSEENKPFSGRIFYERILDLCGRLQQVNFQYSRENEKSEIGRELDRRCTQGLSFALIGKDRSEYELKVEDIVRGKEFRHEGVPIVRLFKTGTSMNAGYVWEKSENSENSKIGVSCCGTPSVLIRILEEAEKLNETEIVIRADSEKLIKSFEARLEIWKRNGWRNSQHKRIAKSAEWEKLWKLKQKIHVFWEIMEPMDEEDREENHKIPIFERK